jgi:hypothetical protein
MATDTFLKLGDIKGKSTDDKHRDEIEVLAFSWGMSQAGSMSGGGGSAGKVTFQDLHCEEGFRDAKWYLGFKQARVKDIRAWSRLFALFVLTLLILTTLGTFCLLRSDQRTKELLRRVASRRRGRCELSLVSAMLSLLQQDRSLLACLLSFTKFKLNMTLDNVS